MKFHQEFVIISLDEHDDDGDPLFWSNTEGWTLIDNADQFSAQETQTLNLPIGGGWMELLS